MRKWIKNLNELTEYQRQHAREQYVWLRSCEDEITEEEYLERNFNGKDVEKELDEILECKSIEVDTEDEFYIYVDL